MEEAHESSLEAIEAEDQIKVETVADTGNDAAATPDAAETKEAK